MREIDEAQRRGEESRRHLPPASDALSVTVAMIAGSRSRIDQSRARVEAAAARLAARAAELRRAAQAVQVRRAAQERERDAEPAEGWRAAG
jgi:predicted  nucleic acid-binding Zn-ribbon protein